MFGGGRDAILTRSSNSHPMGFSTSNQQYTSCTAKLHPRSFTKKKARTQWQQVSVSDTFTRQVTSHWSLLQMYMVIYTFKSLCLHTFSRRGSLTHVAIDITSLPAPERNTDNALRQLTCLAVMHTGWVEERETPHLRGRPEDCQTGPTPCSTTRIAAMRWQSQLH